MMALAQSGVLENLEQYSNYGESSEHEHDYDGSRKIEAAAHARSARWSME